MVALRATQRAPTAGKGDGSQARQTRKAGRQARQEGKRVEASSSSLGRPCRADRRLNDYFSPSHSRTRRQTTRSWVQIAAHTEFLGSPAALRYIFHFSERKNDVEIAPQTWEGQGFPAAFLGALRA